MDEQIQVAAGLKVNPIGTSTPGPSKLKPDKEDSDISKSSPDDMEKV